MSLSENITTLRSMLDNCEKEIKSLEGGRKASSSRARLSLQQIKKGSQALRKEITNHCKALPTKTRQKKEIICPTHAAVEAETEVAAEVEPVKVRKPRVKKVKPAAEE